VGPVPIGTTVQGTIIGLDDYLNYHTYTIEVPPATLTLTIELESDFDLDIAVKYGSEIAEWYEGRDWEYADLTEASGGRIEIPLPTPGTWYVDVIYPYSGGSVNYTLSAQ